MPDDAKAAEAVVEETAAPELSAALEALPAAAGGEQDGGEDAALERQILALQARRAQLAGAGEPVRLKVEEPHSALTYGGITVGRDWTPVPGQHVPAITEQAREAGVTITQES